MRISAFFYTKLPLLLLLKSSVETSGAVRFLLCLFLRKEVRRDGNSLEQVFIHTHPAALSCTT